ncbi:MAG: hypothetical protein P8Z70_13860 [Desulfuromonadales bacterium]
MKKTLILLLAGLVAASLAVGCKDKSATKTASEQTKPAAQAPEQAKPAAQAQASGISGKVVETMDSGGYTYVQVDTGKEKVWAAAPQFKVKVGDPVVIPKGMAMHNYHSKTLNRDFDLVYFVNAVMVGGAQPAETLNKTQMPKGHPPVTQTETKVDFSGLKKAEGGKTVGEIFADKDQLAGKQVVVRAKVVKYNPQIMGKNWLHLEDGTGKAGSNDLTVTTNTEAKVGDTVLVTGVVTTNKDFGAGYKYDVILENAKVKVE